MSSFSSSLALSLLESADEFPVDFDQAMQWWDCKTQTGKSVRRSNLFRKLKDDFEEGRDYLCLKNETEDRPQGGRSVADQIFLTVDCFKSFGMMVSGKRGQEIRAYFLDCEKQVKRSQDIQNVIADRMADRIIAALEPRLTAIEGKLNAGSVGKPKLKPVLQLLQGDLGEDCRTEEDKKRERQEIYNLLKGR